MIREVAEKVEAIESLCLSFRVRRLELFGSATAESFNPESSDLDFLVEFEELSPGEAAQAYFGLLEALQQVFQRKIDLVVSRSIRNPYLLESIRRTKTLLYAA